MASDSECGLLQNGYTYRLFMVRAEFNKLEALAIVVTNYKVWDRSGK